ncbi:MAG: hypothetical protein QXK06_03770 [Candidatus Diapherotrites archaeon]
MKRIVLLLILMVSVFSTPAFADGMAVSRRLDGLWGLHPEKQQVAAINFKDGFQNMLISIDLDSEVRGEKAVWIFPVPASPEKVVIDIHKGFPRFAGEDIDNIYKHSIWESATVMGFYSTIPIIGPIIGAMLPLFMLGTARGVNYEKGITIHESIQKLGVTTELITAKNQDALAQYLQGKGLELPEKSKAIIGEYIGKDYSFVVSYISDLEEFRLESQTYRQNPTFDNEYYPYYESPIPIGVFVKFPTEKIYFPLKPTSVYESAEIPITLFVVGHVSPNLSKETKPLSKTSYFMQNYYYGSTSDSAAFFNNQEIKRLDYTKIQITAPSKYFTEDLWIENSAPITVGLKGFIATNIFWFGLAWFIALCIISSLIAGRLAFKKDPLLSDKKLALHGLWNLLTIIGFGIATSQLKTKTLDPKIEAQLKEQNISVTVRDSRKFAYFFLFYVAFIAITIISAWVLALL